MIRNVLFSKLGVSEVLAGLVVLPILLKSSGSPSSSSPASFQEATVIGADGEADNVHVMKVDDIDDNMLTKKITVCAG